MNLRKAPTALSFLFIAITLARVSHFASVYLKAGMLGTVFAFGMGMAVFVASGNTREHITIKEGAKQDRRSSNARIVAWGLLVLSVLAEGLFNLADTLGAIGTNPAPHVLLGAYVYGIYPTLLVAGFGMLQGYLDRLPMPPTKATHIWQKVIALLYARLENALALPAPLPVAIVPETPIEAPVHKQEVITLRANAAMPVILPASGLPAACRKCGWESAKVYATERAKSNALAAHARGCKGKGKRAKKLSTAVALNGNGHKPAGNGAGE